MYVSVLNSGHGDIDAGAVANGLVERDINMKVAIIAKELMEFNGIIVPPIISGSDLNAVINKVNEINKKQKVNIAHSIHHNAGGGDGSETIHSINYGQGTIFAKILQEEFDKLGQNRHGSGFVTKVSSDGKHDYYGFIRNTDPSAVISEFAFIDSIDYKVIDTYEEQYVEAEAIAKAHCRYYGITFKSPKNTSSAQTINNQGVTKKVKNLVIYIYPEDEGCAKNLAIHLQCPVAYYPKQFTSDLFDLVENVYQVGGVKIDSRIRKHLSGNDMDDSMVEYLKYIGKIK